MNKKLRDFIDDRISQLHCEIMYAVENPNDMTGKNFYGKQK